MSRNKRLFVRHSIDGVRHTEGQTFVGVLFRFGEISANRTIVHEGATVRVAGDAILIEHNYPTMDSYAPVGRVKRFYQKDNAILAEFELYSEEAIEGIKSGRRNYLSVSWVTDDYDVSVVDDQFLLEFNSVIIYEVSLVSNPAFATCIATEEDNLACLPSSVQTNNSGGCGCGGKRGECKCKAGSVSLDGMKHQTEVTREEFEALRELVTQLQDAVAVLQKEVQAIKDATQAPSEEIVGELSAAKNKLAELETQLSTHSNSLEGTLKLVDRLLGVTEKTYRNLPNLIQR